MQKIIKIGTRQSELALWQAKEVERLLKKKGYQTQLVPIKSEGDLVPDKPLYEFGITGIFTKKLDFALLEGHIDLAVHSMKDVPTILPKGIAQVAVLKRANYLDVLVLKSTEEFMGQKQGIVATGSLRRKAQWLNRYPTHQVVNLRGNVITRLKKLNNNPWNGAIFAVAGLERIGKKPKEIITLPWMIPAPAQGAIMLTALEKNTFLKEACIELNDKNTEICTEIEREFLNRLEGGCTAPIGALATLDKTAKQIRFKGILLSKDGRKKIEVSKKANLNSWKYLAKDCAQQMLEKGAKLLMAKEQSTEKQFLIYSTKKISEIQKKILPSTVKLEDNDFIKIRFNRIAPSEVKKPIENVVITSKNGVESLLYNFVKEQINFKNIYCVGRRTKKLIEQKIGKVTHSENKIEKLAIYLSENLKKKEVTYFCSNIRLDTLTSILSSKQINVKEIESYKTIYSPVKIKSNANGVLFYSPSAVKSFMQQNQANTTAFCIGDTTAKEAQKHFKTVHTAKMPSVESLLKKVALHFAKKHENNCKDIN
ncbi:MAG: hydroxymethylbilane synthase [Tenacibaculum sp.]